MVGSTYMEGDENGAPLNETLCEKLPTGSETEVTLQCLAPVVDGDQAQVVVTYNKTNTVRLKVDSK